MVWGSLWPWRLPRQRSSELAGEMRWREQEQATGCPIQAEHRQAVYAAGKPFAPKKVHYISPMIINLWASPRNISTALMYSFAQRSDTRVVDEPLYAHFLRLRPDAAHPGREEILEAMEQDGDKVMRDLLADDGEERVLFLKQMTHHLIDMDRGFLSSCKNVILIRDPKAMLISYSKVLPNPGMADIGIKQSYELARELEAMGQEVLVLNSRRVLEDPAAHLGRLCARLGIGFEEAMLSWHAGAITEDGIWAKYWYANVHRSTGFGAARKGREQLASHLEPLLAECQFYYSYLDKIASCL